jgi:hypothetical protein
MSRYEKDLLPTGRYTHDHTVVGYDQKLRTFYLIANTWSRVSDKPRVQLGTTRQEFTNFEIFATAAKNSGYWLPPNLCEQLLRDQQGYAEGWPIPASGTSIDGWRVMPDEPQPEADPPRCVERAADYAAAIKNNVAYYIGLSEIQRAAVRMAAYWASIDVPVDERFDPAEMILWQSLCDGYEADFPLDDASEEVTDEAKKQPTKTPSAEEKPICDECGSDNVLADALVSWNPETRKYEVDNTMDSWQCFDEDTCDSNETNVRWVDVNAVISRQAVCPDCGAKSDDLETVGNVCSVCKRGVVSAHFEVQHLQDDEAQEEPDRETIVTDCYNCGKEFDTGLTNVADLTPKEFCPNCSSADERSHAAMLDQN